MAMKVFVVAVCALAVFNQVSCFGGNAAALAALGGAGGAPGGFGGAPSGFGGAPGAFGAAGGTSGLGGLGPLLALGGGEGAGRFLKLQLLSQPGFIQQLSQCRLINAVFQG